MTTSIKAVFFSPVGNTRRVVTELAQRVGTQLSLPVKVMDFTLPKNRQESYTFAKEDLVIFGVPTYAGRVPNKALPFVQTLFEGNGALAVPIVTYGNRAFDDALAELRNELELHSFHTIAAGAFVCPHVMSDVNGAKHPDAADVKLMDQLAQGVAQIVQGEREIITPVQVPGHDPIGPYYTPLELDGKRANFLKAKPVTDSAKCDGCGLCVQICPMGSISPEDMTKTPGICIKCHACIRRCPKGARTFEDPSLKSHIAMLEAHYGRYIRSEIWGV